MTWTFGASADEAPSLAYIHPGSASLAANGHPINNLIREIDATAATVQCLQN